DRIRSVRGFARCPPGDTIVPVERPGDETLPATARERWSAGSVDEGNLPTLGGDRYQIERTLGAGGMGIVYAAHDRQLARRVAIKVGGERIASEAEQERLMREARAMAKLHHPNIATVHDVGVSGDRVFVVMELIEGGTLADWLRAGPRSWRQIVGVYLQAARGLGAAHAAGFVHRDF